MSERPDKARPLTLERIVDELPGKREYFTSKDGRRYWRKVYRSDEVGSNGKGVIVYVVPPHIKKRRI
jgi:hypothetical protein